MNNSLEFTLILNKINKMISDLNIDIFKNPENLELKEKLNKLISDKELLYTCTEEEFKSMMIKYGEKIDG